MSLDKYLENRETAYIVTQLEDINLSRYNSDLQYKALLTRVSTIAATMSESITFLDDNEESVLKAIESALSTLEIKVQVIRNAARFLSKSKLEVRSVSSESDISIIDLSKGSFNGLNYSFSDSGVVLDSGDTKHLKAEIS